MVVLFDVNGTLTDPAGIGDPWDAPELGLRVLRGAVLSSMAATITERFVPFAEHLRDALALEVAAAGLDPQRLDAALRRAAALDAYADAAPAIDLLRDHGCTIAALTNSGAEAGANTLRAAGLRDRFDHVFGVDAVRRFKPHPATYGHVVRELDVPPGDITMVAAHAWDVTGARSAGLRAAWVSRGEGVLAATAAPPHVRGPDLLAVARLLVGEVACGDG